MNVKSHLFQSLAMCLIVLAVYSVRLLGADEAPSSDATKAADAAAADATKAADAPGVGAVEPESHAAHKAGGHHDESDLSHANAGAQQDDPSELRSDLALFTFVVFLCLLLLLMKFAWGPIMEGLDKREASIANNIEEAKQSAAKAEKALEQYQVRLAAAADETRELIAQAKKDAEAAKDRIVAEAKSAAEKERRRAIADIRTAKDMAVQELAAMTVDNAVKLAGHMLRKEVDAKAHGDLIKEALAQFPSQN